MDSVRRCGMSRPVRLTFVCANACAAVTVSVSNLTFAVNRDIYLYVCMCRKLRKISHLNVIIISFGSVLSRVHVFWHKHIGRNVHTYLCNANTSAHSNEYIFIIHCVPLRTDRPVSLINDLWKSKCQLDFSARNICLLAPNA